MKRTKSIPKRTKDELIYDAVVILKSELTAEGKYMGIHDICCKGTELNGKYNGCKYWSVKAIELLKELNLKGESFEYRSFFRHEHIVPKKVFITILLSLNPEEVNEKLIEYYINNFLIGTVVTKIEDSYLNKGYKQSMPKEFFDTTNADYNNPWLRYKVKKIQVKNVKWENNNIIEEGIVNF